MSDRCEGWMKERPGGIWQGNAFGGLKCHRTLFCPHKIQNIMNAVSVDSSIYSLNNEWAIAVYVDCSQRSIQMAFSSRSRHYEQDEQQPSNGIIIIAIPATGG